MGIVRSIQKGEQPASKFSKKAQDAAKKMKKSSVKKYAKTKHDDLPTKKEFLNTFGSVIDEAIDSLVLNEGVDDPGIFKAIFLAGGPGSGKTFVSQKLFGIPERLTTSAKGLKLVNQDTEFEMLLKKYFGTIEIDKFPPEEFADLVKSAEEGGTGMRQYAKSLNKEKLRLYKKGRLGVIIDGTAHKVDSIKKKKKELEKIGYDTYMVFVNTSLEAALDRNEKRDRTVPVKVAKKSWQDVQNNMGKLQSIFGKSNFQVVDNSKHLQPEEAEKKFNMLVKKGIDKFMKKPIQSKIAKDWVKKQRELKKRGIKESTLMSENPAAIAAAQRMVVQNKAGKKVSVMTAKNTSYKDKDPSAHRKAKSIFQRIVDKFKKKKEVKEVSLKKLENAIMALKNKMKKQGKKTNARDEKHLERLMKIYNKMGGRKIKENNESFNWLYEKCWKGYEKKGMKTMFGKRYPNCVKKKKKSESVDEGTCGYGIDGKIGEEPAGPNLMKKIKKISKDKEKKKLLKSKIKEDVEMSKGVKKLMKIADEGFGKVGGTTVDSMSAGLFKQIYNKVNDDIKKKLNTKNEKQLVRIIGGMWKKFGKNVKIGSSL